MHLCKMELENFRCFSDLSIDFHERQTVLIGANGSGKSAILDAVALALGSYLAGVDGAKSNAIHHDDVREKMFFHGSIPTREPMYPSRISALAECASGKKMKWSRSLNRAGGRTTVKDAHPVMDFAAELQQRVRQGDEEAILPLVAYYGTGRLWNQKQTHMVKKKTQPAKSRFKGYEDCLDAATNEKRMLQWFSRMTYAQLQDGKVLPELFAVEKAMADCYAGIDREAVDTNIRFNVKTDELELLVQRKQGALEYLPLNLLSDGIRTILNMVADIAYRMAVLNPQLLGEALQRTDGIVLIDEIDMHLHPAWQKRILKDLCHIFPKIQFIVTTHAPSVLVNIPRENIRILENGQVRVPNQHTYGREVSAVLTETMQTDVVPVEIRKNFQLLYQAVDQKDLPRAEQILENLKDILGENDGKVIDAQIAIDMEKNL